MKRSELVSCLIETDSRSAQKALLTEFSRLADLDLAYSLKDTFYNLWTTEPKKVQTAASALAILARLRADREIAALADWVQAISYLTKGKTGQAVRKLDSAAEFFLLEGRELTAAQTRVSKLYALAVLGRYEEAVQCAEAALKVFVKFKDQLAAGRIEHNLGNIMMRQERYQEARQYLISARKRFVKIQNIPQIAMAENALAIIYALLNDFRRAEALYSQALQRARELDMAVTQAEIEASMGNLALFRGAFQPALQLLESSREKYLALKMPHQELIAELEIADAYLELNLAAESVEIYRRITPALAALKMKAEEARARLQFGRALIAAGSPDSASQQLKKAARLFAAEGNEVGTGTVRLIEARLALDSGAPAAAANAAKEAGEIFAAMRSLRNRLMADWIRGEALRRNEDRAGARRLLNRVLGRAVKHEHFVAAQLAHVSLGKLELQREAEAKAEKHFHKAIELVESLRAPLPAEEFRMAFLTDKLVPYYELAAICLRDQNRIEEAFLYIEEARSRALAEAIEENPAAGGEAHGKFAAEISALREELNWFYSRINRARPADVKALQQEAKIREKKLAELMRRAGSSRKRRGASRQALNLALLQKQLGENRVLIEYFVMNGKFSAFVLTNNGIKVFRDICRENEIGPLLEQLHFQFGALRYGRAALAQFAETLTAKANFYLQKLYDRLLRPLEEFLDGWDIVVVPYGELHYTPFHALHNGESYLIEKAAVSYAPSAAVLQKCLSRAKSGVGDVFLAGFADEKIPLVNEEIRSLAKLFKAKRSFTGERATFAAFRENAGDAGILHLACHGEFRPDNPLFSSLRLSDGWLTVRDVRAMKLRADLATLSACGTGLNTVFGGDELLGLARGFLSAGAASLLLTLWTVNDAAAIELMKSFYRDLLSGRSKAESLRRAQLQFIGRGSHPYFWSPFVLVGQW